ncbi:hypothetical protein KSC_042260 [Ktedonobacter sp. SOSP1-52]|uniref:hypothetical protein n=1 Tax=Ktedonobacter sp. SOSP1-52 TaxID=2778366 RepID=UPI0019152227|nr:hypothetical protein [Ktedonobacter sp. SOSP1-52]GHO65334.1 hypothetical protein KSC_042260 [Ktedonobacter sp. SOSP1-52]
MAQRGEVQNIIRQDSAVISHVRAVLALPYLPYAPAVPSPSGGGHKKRNSFMM